MFRRTHLTGSDKVSIFVLPVLSSHKIYISTLPTNEKTRQEYLLHEYDRRLNTQVAYQAANFEIHDAFLINIINSHFVSCDWLMCYLNLKGVPSKMAVRKVNRS